MCFVTRLGFPECERQRSVDEIGCMTFLSQTGQYGRKLAHRHNVSQVFTKEPQAGKANEKETKRKNEPSPEG